MILNDVALRQRAIDGLVSATLSNVQGSSNASTLGSTIKVEVLSAPAVTGLKSLVSRATPSTLVNSIVAHTAETITIVDDCSAMGNALSSAARAGYEHSLAGMGTLTGQITLVLRNPRFRHPAREPVVRFCQFGGHKLEAAPEQLCADWQLPRPDRCHRQQQQLTQVAA